VAHRVQEAADLSIAVAPAVRSCPLCAGGDHRLFLPITVSRGPAAGSYELRRCTACGLVFVEPRLADPTLATLYDQDFYFSTGWPYRGFAEWIMREIQRTRRRRVQRYVPSGSLLDVGCGDGRFVRHMAEHGWQATGVDFSAAALTLAQSRDSAARFLYGSLFDHDFEPASVDLVTLWQVLEHIGEPREFLGRCRDLMRPGGVFVAAVPNIEGLSARLTGERWWGLDVPRHLVHYSPRTLCHGLEEAGFTVLKVNHLSLQYDPYALLHSSLDWVFTRRHFLSDLAKQQIAADVSPLECAYNVAALAVLGPVMAPLCLVTSAAASCFGRGGFIEVFARREGRGPVPKLSR
jgi:SAM-dependent methyltransferase